MSASATVTDAALESAQVFIADVELSENLGGSATSPCTAGIFVDAELNAVSAPPDDSAAIGPGSTSRTVVLPDGETGALSALANMISEAQAEPMPMPTLPAGMAVALLLALIGAGWWRLARRPARL